MNKTTTNKPLPPAPEGYQTWLDYAVATMDTRSPHLDQYGTDRYYALREFSREEMEAAILFELDALRAAAKVEDTYPKRFRPGAEAVEDS